MVRTSNAVSKGVCIDYFRTFVIEDARKEKEKVPKITMCSDESMLKFTTKTQRRRSLFAWRNATRYQRYKKFQYKRGAWTFLPSVINQPSEHKQRTKKETFLRSSQIKLTEFSE